MWRYEKNCLPHPPVCAENGYWIKFKKEKACGCRAAFFLYSEDVRSFSYFEQEVKCISQGRLHGATRYPISLSFNSKCLFFTYMPYLSIVGTSDICGPGPLQCKTSGLTCWESFWLSVSLENHLTQSYMPSWGNSHSVTDQSDRVQLCPQYIQLSVSFCLLVFLA